MKRDAYITQFINYWLQFQMPFSHSLFLYIRETTDTYTITASPSFGVLQFGPSTRYSSFDIHGRSNYDLDAKSPLLPAYEKTSKKEDLDRISRTQSSRSGKASLHEQLTGELPIAHGCSFTQTIFNGKK